MANQLSVLKYECSDWQDILDQSVTCPFELCKLLGLDPAIAAEAKSAVENFPLLVPRPFLARIQPGKPDDPLLLQVLPRAAETACVPGFSADPLNEVSHCWGNRILRKYQGRILIVTTMACAVHCRFCFRRHFSLKNASPPFFSPSELQKIAADTSLREIILSGGDPLMVSDEILSDFLSEISEIPHLRRVRIHSRMPVVLPQRVTEQLVMILCRTRLTPIVVLHINHPQELDEHVLKAFQRLREAGIPLLSQSVLLRGVNDDVEVLARLFEMLVDTGVMPYYLHQLDRVAGAAHFEVAEETGRAIIAQLRTRLPGYAVPRYVRDTPDSRHKEILA